MKTTIKSLMTTVALAGALGGCAAVPSSQLLTARDAYAASSLGLASKLTPAEVHEAKLVLDQANKEFAEHGDTPESRDYAYVAERKLMLADTRARTELDREKISAAVRAGVVMRDNQAKSSRAELASTREQLEDERRDHSAANNELRAANASQGKELDKIAGSLEVEKQARASVEGKLADAMKDLATIAAIKEDARGLVITLSGSVLFPSGSFTLLNTAMTKLDQVAAALMAQDSSKQMVVEGHTDSQGSDRTNQPLSLNRATAVRDYLVGRGVHSDRISAIGLGSTRPVADNKSAENRANNRRVEIVISNPSLTHR